MQGIIIYKQLFEIMEEITFGMQIVKCRIWFQDKPWDKIKLLQYFYHI